MTKKQLRKLIREELENINEISVLQLNNVKLNIEPGKGGQIKYKGKDIDLDARTINKIKEFLNKNWK